MATLQFQYENNLCNKCHLHEPRYNGRWACLPRSLALVSPLCVHILHICVSSGELRARPKRTVWQLHQRHPILFIRSKKSSYSEGIVSVCVCVIRVWNAAYHFYCRNHSSPLSIKNEYVCDKSASINSVVTLNPYADNPHADFHHPHPAMLLSICTDYFCNEHRSTNIAIVKNAFMPNGRHSRALTPLNTVIHILIWKMRWQQLPLISSAHSTPVCWLLRTMAKTPHHTGTQMWAANECGRMAWCATTRHKLCSAFSVYSSNFISDGFLC